MTYQLRTWHKWLGLFVGLQVLIWCVSGLYMVAANIDFIHGDSLVRDEQPPLADAQNFVFIGSLLTEHQGLYGARLTVLPDTKQAIYVLRTQSGAITLDAVSGEVLSPLPQARIERLARTYYAGGGSIMRTALIEAVPVEIRGRAPNLWRVDFDDWLNTSFYLDPGTGALVTRRHRLWRIFDAFWMLHIMDYGYERDDMNNKLLRVASALGVVFGLTGVWLLFYSFRRPTRAQRRS